MEIVKFKNGKYAVRKRVFLWYKYSDIDANYWWGLNLVGTYCQGTLKEIICLFNKLNDYGEVVEDVQRITRAY